MESFNNLSDHQKGEFMKHLEEQTMKDSLRMYNNLVESCFDKCVHVGWSGFQSKKLEDSESSCISNCTMKYMKGSQRAGFRFGEYQALNGKK